MDIIDAFLLGLIQGLTEFLPISSSGHLVLGKALLSGQLGKSITYEVVVHFGTLCSILVYYRNRLVDIFGSLVDSGRTGKGIAGKLTHDDNVKLTGFIVLSMIPAVLVGFFLKDQLEDIFMNPFMVSIMLLVTGLILFATRFRSHFTRDLTTTNTFMIGIAQALAIMPGISRSGATISLGLYLGVKREKAANFSFLMVIPVIAGAMVLQLTELASVGVQTGEIVNLVIGFFVAFISGYYALKYLILLLRVKGIHPFAWYCWLLGVFGLWYFG